MTPERTPLERAQDLLGLDELPDDIREQIKALEEEADDNEAPLFFMIWEGLETRENHLA